MPVLKIFQIFLLTAFFPLLMLGCTVSQQAQMMNGNSVRSNKNVNNSADNSGQSASGQPSSSSMNPGSNTAAPSNGLTKYPDKKIDSLPKKPVSSKYIVEHRSALNDKIITVKGIIVAVSQPPAANAPPGVAIMGNPQPLIRLAESSKDSRDANYDLMIYLGEGENRYAINQKIAIKVRVESSRGAVVLRKI